MPELLGTKFGFPFYLADPAPCPEVFQIWICRQPWIFEFYFPYEQDAETTDRILNDLMEADDVEPANHISLVDLADDGTVYLSDADEGRRLDEEVLDFEGPSGIGMGGDCRDSESLFFYFRKGDAVSSGPQR